MYVRKVDYVCSEYIKYYANKISFYIFIFRIKGTI